METNARRAVKNADFLLRHGIRVSPETLPSRVPRFNYVTGGDATTTTTQPGPLLFVNWNIINIPLAVVLTTLDIEQRIT